MSEIRAVRFTKDDYLSLPEGFPAELLEGVLVKDPAPSTWHQHLVLELAIRARAVVGPGRLVVSPVDVVIDDENVLQPDLLVLPEGERVRYGAEPSVLPVAAFEVLSPSTATRDRDRKSRVYLDAGVREVWLVDPDAETIEVLTTGGAARFAAAETARSVAVPGLAVTYQELAGAGGP